MITEFLTKTPVVPGSVFVADGARIVGDVEIGDLSSVWFNAVIRGDVNTIRIGERTNIQDGVTVHGTFREHSTRIGNDVSIGHGAIVHGCTIENHALIGMGAMILDGAIIGHFSLVAAGALIREGYKVPERTLMAGVPAKPIRKLTDMEIHNLQDTPKRYIEYARSYRKHGMGESHTKNGAMS